ncbi:MAG: flagellar basal-body rod protein FlgG [Candidatus Melainabacteria bacterium RIFOXYA2_FULL_32_9]|nr:MAG: flagellar basal-body rod protein FlgG [Candidatus Melainabacteria bacterium RIFOXYA2_FULL_32_9]
MLRALTTAATGMVAQQMNIDVISNNLANVNTTGYKKVRTEFQDLLSQTLKAPGAQGAQGTNQPVGIQIGLGTRTSATNRIFTEGVMKSTGNKLDVAIEGDGFLQVQLDDGTPAYTRDGSLKIDGNGQLTTSDGFIVQPQVTIPANATDITITSDGRVSIKTAGDTAQTEVGSLQLAKFANPAGLEAIGKNLYKETSGSGTAIQGTAGQEGFGSLQQNFLEGSNVQVVEELISLIQAERAFEVNSKLITAADNMLKNVNRIG